MGGTRCGQLSQFSRRMRARIASLAVIAVLGCGGQSGSVPTPDETPDAAPSSLGCIGGGTEYVNGSLVPVDCNVCICVDGALQSCSTKTCGVPVARCRTYQDCPADELCVAPACAEDGVCVPRIECPLTGSPACSCSGTTEENACVAARSGFAVAHLGACEDRPCELAGGSREHGALWEAEDGCNVCSCVDGAVRCSTQSCVPCGGSSGNPCGADEYCRFAGTDCGATSTGFCQLRPKGSCQIEASSVCGCDGNRYRNYCEAAAAGMSVGECSGPPP